MALHRLDQGGLALCVRILETIGAQTMVQRIDIVRKHRNATLDLRNVLQARPRNRFWLFVAPKQLSIYSNKSFNKLLPDSITYYRQALASKTTEQLSGSLPRVTLQICTQKNSLNIFQ